MPGRSGAAFATPVVLAGAGPGRSGAARAQAIFYQLQRDGLSPLPSVRTVHRVLVRNGLVQAQPNKRPRSSWHRFAYDAPNGCWQIDATEWRLGNDPPR